MDKAIVARPHFPPGRRIIAVSDIHGNLPFFRALMDKIGLTPDDSLVLLGDMLEKGRDSLALLRYLMELSKTHTLYPVCGNCDGLVLRFFETDELDGRFFASYLPRHPESALRQMAREGALSSGTTCPACAGTCAPPSRRSGPGSRPCLPSWRRSTWSLFTGVSPPWRGWRSWTGGNV